MSLTLTLSPEAETRLRQQAAAAGKEPEQYAAQLIEGAIGGNGNGASAHTSAEEQRRLQAIADELLDRAEEIEPDPNRPRLTGQEAEIEQIIFEKYVKERSQP